MDPLFSGSIARQRQINLGGTLAGPSSTTQLATQARQAREARNALRKSHEAAVTVQRHWRGSSVRGEVRKEKQRQFALLANDSAAVLQATRALLAGISIFNTKTRVATKYRGRDAPHQDELLAQWCRHLSTHSASLDTLAHSATPLALALATEVEWRLRFHARVLPQPTQVVYLVFLQDLWRRAGVELLRAGQYRVVTSVVAAFPKGKVTPALGEAAASALLAPFALLSAATHPTERQHCIATLADEILQLPSFRSFPVAQLGRIGASLPTLDLAAYYTDRTKSPTPTYSWRLALDNFTTLCNHKLPKWDNGNAVATHLDALASLQYAAVSTSPSPPPLTKSMVSKDLATALAASNKYPASTRPALHRYLLGFLANADSFQASQIASAVLYGSTTTASRGGPIREIWRGYIRGTPLARALAKISSNAEDVTFLEAKQGWEAILLLAELYSRILGTLADDEFLPSGGPSSETAHSSDLGALGNSAAHATGSTVAAQNPLSLDEVLDFAAIVKNLAFVSYWHIDAPATDQQRQTRTRPKTTDRPLGVVYTYSQIRDLSTRLIQQLHTRDTRHRFTPDGFWDITAGLDISQYLDWILSEDERLTEEAADADAGGEDVDEEGDVDMADDDAVAVALPARSKITRTSHMSARRLAIASPRLGILNNVPFVIPFHTRVDVFDSFVRRDAERMGIRDHWYPDSSRSIKATIRRDHIAEDGMAGLNHFGSGLKRTVIVKFLDQFGMEELGIDGGGLFKEFLTSLAKEAFDTDRGLWRVNERQELYPNPSAYARQPEQLEWYKFLGRIVGKGLYDGILVDLRFAPFFLSKLLGRQQHHFTDDLASLDSLDPELYRGLIYLKNYTGDVENDLSLNFTITDDEFGERKVTELVPNGSNVPVTSTNRTEYIHRVARYRLDFQIRRQSEAFLAGVSDLINPRWLRIFDQVELQELIKGADSPIDISDLRSNTVYSDYHEKDVTIEYFWQAMESFDQPTRAAVLKFITSCPSPPLLGFKTLHPKVCIRLAGEDEQRLPTSSTCVNLLKLPRYSSFEVCRDKVLTAVRSGAGFDLA